MRFNYVVPDIALGSRSTTVRNRTILELRMRPISTAAQHEKVLTDWYRRELKAMIPPLIAKWEPTIGVAVAEWGVKQVKTR